MLNSSPRPTRRRQATVKGTPIGFHLRLLQDRLPPSRNYFNSARLFVSKRLYCPNNPRLQQPWSAYGPRNFPPPRCPQLPGNVSWHQVQQLKNKQEDTLKTNEERQEAHSPGRGFAMCPTVRCSKDWYVAKRKHVFCPSLDDVFWEALRMDVLGGSSLATPFDQAAVSVMLLF